MEIKDLSKYSNAEKILLAEQLWDSVAKSEIELSCEIEMELDHRLQLLEEGKTTLYSLDEVKSHINKIRK
ncbi:addiction module protein [Flavobacterium sp.]|uniref:addiction module protein n=1 Tax=Flavobacterium sp. TaxID=239 RepID=UPI003919320C